MAKQVMTPQEEALAQAQAQTENFFEKHSKAVVIAMIAIFVLAAAIFGYKKLVSEPRMQAAQEMLYKAQYQFEQQNADLALALNGDENTPGFAQVAEQYGNTPAGNLANLYAAACSIRLGEVEAAESYLAKFKNVKGTPGEIINAMAAGLKGDIAVEKGDNAAAAAAFEAAAKVSDNLYTAPMYLRKAAQAYTALGNEAKAKECLEVIIDKYANSPEAANALKLAK
ncbi:MAG: tetratricopeptide repeat protein [Alistipes sp.]|jgi:TolA-binding protein|nr:tetratricopeptide repeat protein [Alistipes sp.]